MICVICDGQYIGICDVSGMSEDDIIIMMVGCEFIVFYFSELYVYGEEILWVEYLIVWYLVNCYIKWVNDVLFFLCCGEIFGIVGLVGVGCIEVVQCLFGVWLGCW